ncbi:MAG: hypothetical protein LBT23_06020 [Synergistaceae bacterium]|nr:hypothetical protein [Synergistaceae bacterium]
MKFALNGKLKPLVFLFALMVILRPIQSPGESLPEYTKTYPEIIKLLMAANFALDEKGLVVETTGNLGNAAEAADNANTTQTFNAMNEISNRILQLGSISSHILQPDDILEWVPNQVQSGWITESDGNALLEVYLPQVETLKQLKDEREEMLEQLKTEQENEEQRAAQIAREREEAERERHEREEQAKKQEELNWYASISDDDCVAFAKSLHFPDYEGFSTIGEAFDKFFDKPKWAVVNRENPHGDFDVTFSGIGPYGGKNALYKILFVCGSDFGSGQLKNRGNSVYLSINNSINDDDRSSLWNDLLATMYLN